MINHKNKSKIKLTALLLILTVVFGIIVYNFILITAQTLYPRKYSALVESVSAEYNLDEVFLYAVIKTESSFNKDAVSDVGAKGLTQIMPDTFKWLKSKTGESLPENALFQPETSIKYGGFLLSYLLEEFENPKTALAAYHAGITRVNEWLENPEYSKDGETLYNIPYESTALYTEKVLKNVKAYIKIYNYTEEMKYEY